jgi:viroplasmin and RNaseH domain-containing protein
VHETNTTRSITNALVTGFQGNRHKGFRTYNEAKEYMATYGIETYTEILDPLPLQGLAQHRSDHSYYAVANGRKPGIYLSYGLVCNNLVKPFIDKIHKFGSRGTS